MVWIVLSVVFALAALAAGGACLWCFADRRSLRAEHRRLQSDLQSCDGQRQKLSEENGDLLRRLERAEAETEAAQKQFAEAQKQSRETFQSLAADALKSANEQFLHLARKSFESEQKDAAAQLEQRKQAIGELLKPIRETLDKYDTNLKNIEKSRTDAYASLREQVGSLKESQKQLRDETAALVKALRRPEVRGRWGEMQLRRVAELAGMIRYCDFDEQVTVKTVDGVTRPDMLVKLPSSRTIVVDAKTSLDAFIEAVECDDDGERSRCLERHARQVESKVRELAAKGYQSQFERSPDFVVLFIPGESFLHAAVQIKPELIESAMSHGVLIASPTTLISLLKAVAVGWREEQITESARQISTLGQELHERIAVATSYVETLGRHLENAVKSYNQFVGSFESRVLVSARKFKELGADSAKELPAEGATRQVEAMVREVKAG